MKRILAGLALALAAAIAWPAANTFNVNPAPSGMVSAIRIAPTYVDARVLAANVAETHTVPTGAGWVLFAANCNFYAKTGASAAVPAADVTDGSASELNPAAWQLPGGTTQITLIAPTACVVTMAFYN